jgi:hypothetical protein
MVETTGDEVTPVTTIVMFADDDAEIAHVMCVGTDDGYPVAVDGLLDHLDKIEAYRLGDAPPEFDHPQCPPPSDNVPRASKPLGLAPH